MNRDGKEERNRAALLAQIGCAPSVSVTLFLIQELLGTLLIICLVVWLVRRA